jgi:2-C-methyl-D-erythritol 2,4-cyclodiphosphate synthase
MPLADTVKRVDPAAAAPMVAQTLDRKTLWSAQTPQVFRLGSLIAAYEQDPTATDEASAIERAGGRVHLVQGDASNIKLTTPGDIVLMEALMTHPQSSQGKPSAAGPAIAIGQGFDVHALTTGRPLVLGGVEIPFEKGLAGHSDADVLLHAITDAILGAAGLGDIGRHFPDTDPAYRGADSRMLLREAVAKVAAKGWQVAQIDATVIAQQPKIAPYAETMVRSIADCVGAAEGCINIKGKTTEHLGFTGRGEGIAAQAVAMLSRRTA